MPSNLPLDDPCQGLPLSNRPMGYWQNMRNLNLRLPDCEEGDIFLMTAKLGESEQKFYKLAASSNTLTLISTQDFDEPGPGFHAYGTIKRLGVSHYAFVESETLYRSRDDCVTWEPVLPLSTVGFTPVTFSIDAGGRIWVIGESGLSIQGLWYSDDDGDNWVLLDDDFADFHRIDTYNLECHPNDQNVFFGSGFDYDTSNIGIIYTTDRGLTWSKFTLPAESGYMFYEIKNCIWLNDGSRFAVVDQDYSNLANGGSEEFALKFFWSDNPTGGAGTFTQVVLDEPITDYTNPVISVSADGDTVIVSATETHPSPSDGFAPATRFWLSRDSGVSFTAIESFPARFNYDNIVAQLYDATMDRLIVITTGAFNPLTSEDEYSRIWVSRPPGENYIEITPEEELSFILFMCIWR